MSDGINDDLLPNRTRRALNVALACFAFLFVGLAYAGGMIMPPKPERGTVVEITKGMNAEEIAHALKNGGVIRSTTLFVWSVYLGGLETKLGAGRFQFSDPATLFDVVSTLSAGKKEITIVIPEGVTFLEIASLFEKSGLAKRDDIVRAFALTAEREGLPSLEGYLFPDTYRFFELTPADEIVRTLREHFNEKVRPYEAEIAKSGRTMHDVITMASILEREAQREEDWQVIAGILWRRLATGMRLQVDASLGYVTGKASSELTADDLKSQSPYNTYVRYGLPPTPIGNPGIATIEAALRPVSTAYVYYLSDASGTMHYARTFEEHKKNKARYLK